jgi:hypothetical protein
VYSDDNEDGGYHEVQNEARPQPCPKDWFQTFLNRSIGALNHMPLTLHYVLLDEPAS